MPPQPSGSFVSLRLEQRDACSFIVKILQEWEHND